MKGVKALRIRLNYHRGVPVKEIAEEENLRPSQVYRLIRPCTTKKCKACGKVFTLRNRQENFCPRCQILRHAPVNRIEALLAAYDAEYSLDA